MAEHAVDFGEPRGPASSRVHPNVVSGLRVHSVLAVMELISMGLGIGVLPVFLAAGRPDLVAPEAPADDHPNDLWMLTHRESRHLPGLRSVWAPRRTAAARPVSERRWPPLQQPLLERTRQEARRERPHREHDHRHGAVRGGTSDGRRPPRRTGVARSIVQAVTQQSQAVHSVWLMK